MSTQAAIGKDHRGGKAMRWWDDNALSMIGGGGIVLLRHHGKRRKKVFVTKSGAKREI
jgi:hypothetical protein